MDHGLRFSYRDRAKFLHYMADQGFDLLVVGGGITGAGIALDGITRGLKVALIEKGDFASGTSGKSTKLIHGGLRYLKQFEFGLVKEIGRERAILHELAPHIVVPEKMVLPLIKGGSLGKVMTSIGLYIYDFLADVEGEDKRRMLDEEEILAIEPLLPPEKILGGSIYAEYRTDDARLTIEVMKTAHRHGLLALNYLEGIEFIESEGRIRGMRCRDVPSGQVFDLKAKVVVNATGPWVDEVRRLSEPVKGKRLYLSKGSHLVVPRSKLPCKHALYFDVPNDGRMIFAIPRLDTTYIGTTDTYFEGDKDRVSVSQADCEYLLNAVNLTFPSIQLTQEDIISSWSGIRPLIYEDGKSASEISRRDEIFESQRGLVSIAGGKLTGYRKMAERVVDLVADRLKKDFNIQAGPCRTSTIALTERPFASSAEVDAAIRDLTTRCEAKGLDPVYGTYLVHNYGRTALELWDLALQGSEDSMERNLVQAEITYGVENEMIVSPLDFAVRRTARVYFMPESLPMVEQLIFHYFRGELKLESSILEDFRIQWQQRMEEKTTLH